jgi:hypothetical protein
MVHFADPYGVDRSLRHASGTVKPASCDADINASQTDHRIALPEAPMLNECLVAAVLLHRSQSTVHRGQ